MPFFIIFFLVPVAEVFVFLKVGQWIGVLETLLLCVLTAGIGGLLVRHQGLETLFKARREMQSGQLPVTELFDGLCLVAAGAMLITPGFVTDIIGFALLVPAMRTLLRRWAARHFQIVEMGQTDPDIVEGTYERVDPQSTPQKDADKTQRLS